ncbi:MAG: diguanylate cyclase [Ignavibacteriae bacterium]|nr:MAG: diguanylate cyclase [Ignavibacteriota bacterium]
MFLTSRNKKRVLIFLIIPILAFILVISNDILIKSIVAIVLVIYVAFIIFLRDSMQIKGIMESDAEIDDEMESGDLLTAEESARKTYDTDLDESIKIISKDKVPDIITSQNYAPSQAKMNLPEISKEEIKKQFDKIVTEELPSDVTSDEQFLFVLEKILNVIKEAYLANSVIFFWYNENNKELTLKKYFSNSDKAITKKQFPLEDDIISKIVQNQEPVHLNEIYSTAELDVIRYYDKPQGIKSLVGVPLFYADSLTGVLVVDSKAPDAFGIETVYSLGRFVRIIAIIISLFDKNFSNTTSENRLNALLSILKINKKFDSENDILDLVNKSIKQLIQYDAFTFVYYRPTDQKFVVLKAENNTPLKYVGKNLEIDLDSTLVGKAILSAMPVNIEDTSSEEYNRFTKNEDVGLGGSFLAIPLIYNKQNFGVLCFESLKKKFYSNDDVDFMRNALRMFSFFVYTYSTHTVLKNLLSVDVETGALTYEAFVKQANIDLIKADKFNAPCTIALIRIDDFLEERSLFETDPFPKVLESVFSIIKNESTELNTIGRISKKLFAVHFFNTNAKEVFVWSEKLRTKIARKPISVVLKQTTFTVSIGVASSNHATEVEDILKDAELALNKAIEKGGNTVKSVN